MTLLGAELYPIVLRLKADSNASRALAGHPCSLAPNVTAFEQEQSPMPGLTTRQLQILVLIANGKNTKEIAAALGISSKTVGAHRSNIMRRLDVHDIAGLVRYSIRNGLAKV